VNTQPLNAARLVVIAAFAFTCFGLMLFLWSAFGGAVPLTPKGYQVVVALPEADGLSTQADVRISGVRVGRVVGTGKAGASGDAARKDATLEIDSAYAPLRRDARATIRRKSLLGEEYLELTPGGLHAPAVPDGGRLAGARVAPSVEIDELLRTFDPATRAGLQTWIGQQAIALSGRGDDLNAAFGTLPAFTEDFTALLTTLNRQAGAVRAAVRDTGAVFSALSVRGDALRGAIVNGRRATDAFAARAGALAETFKALPTFEAESRRLLARAERFRRNADPVLTALRPGFRELGVAARDLPATAREVDGLAHDLGGLTAAGARGLPATQRFVDGARPLIAEFVPLLGQLIPVLDYAGPNIDSLTSLVGNVAAATQPVTAGYDGQTLHYLRAGMTLQPDGLAQYPHRLPGSRANPYDSGTARLSATQPYNVFDDRNCARPLTYPTLGPSDAGAKLPAELMERIRHFVLNDDQPVGPPCNLQSSGPAFPRITALSHTPQGP
jgi:virulence factor Mce-like protein